MKLKILYSALIIFILTSCASTSNYTVNLNESTLSQGGLTLFRIEETKKSDALSASFSGGEVFIVSDETGTWGIVATDLEEEPGKYELSFKRGKKSVETEIEVIGEDYGTESLNLPSAMVTLDNKAIDRVIKESALIKGIWSKSNKEPFWKEPFIMPLKGRSSNNFGVRRIMNNKPRPPHSGMDIAAPRGTPVKAANAGKVAFTGDFYFNGNFVVIDHGLGVFTLYAHLNQILVKTGTRVKKGEVIGKVGSSGRSTGAHLHFGVKIGTVRVSPAELFEILNNPQEGASSESL